MSKKTLMLVALAVALFAGFYNAAAQLKPSDILNPSPNSWPTFHGDYSGRHYSKLRQINRVSVKSLSLAWTARLNPSAPGVNVGGFGPEPTQAGAPNQAQIKATPLVVDGTVYVSSPNNAYAIDERTGRQLWHYLWRSQGGVPIGNRGLGMWGGYVFLDTPDQHIVALDAATGKERWNQTKADYRGEEYATSAPVVIGNHVLTPVGGDGLDVPGWLESRDPETGELQWRWYSTPRAGEPGIETWPSVFAAEHGGASPWQPVTYDPDLDLIYVGTGNPQPVLIGDSRPGDNLWTCSIVALHPETGKMAWYFQVSPHDTHDWDATQTPVLFDATINGKPRKLLAQASRNGMFVVLDRTNGKNVLTVPFIESANAFSGINKEGQPIPNPLKEAQKGGSLVSPSNGGAANWPPAAYNPGTGLFYTNSVEGFEIVYRVLPDGQNASGYGGGAEHDEGGLGAALRAIDPLTGKQRWVHWYPGDEALGPRPESLGGLLTTAGGLIFAGGPSNNVMAMDAADGKILWHSGLQAQMSNAPITYMLDGAQFILVAAGDTLYAFSIQQ